MLKVMRIKRLLLTLLLLGSLCDAHAQLGSDIDTLEVARTPQEIDLKTNFVYDATASVNLGLEIGLGRRWSVDISGNYNGWTFADNRKWKHWFVQPEFRFWTGEPRKGHFIGIHAIGGVYNLNRMHLPFEAYPATATQRHEGWGAGVGLCYGYRWNFSERWGMEGVIGVGYIYTEYDKFCPNNCGVRIAQGDHNYFGPTKLALNLIYRFGKKKREAAAARRAVVAVPEPIVRERIVRDTVIVRDTTVIRDTVVVREPAPIAATTFRNEIYTLHLQYGAGSAKLLRNLADNQQQLIDFKEFIDRIQNDSTIVIHRISLTGYCSIEGTAQLNDRLSYARAHSIEEYLLGFYPWIEDILHVDGRGEDWNGLLRMVEESDNNLWKSDIRRIILNTGVYEGREKRLMDLDGGAPYRWMFREFFPKLRRIECNVEYTIREE